MSGDKLHREIHYKYAVLYMYNDLYYTHVKHRTYTRILCDYITMKLHLTKCHIVSGYNYIFWFDFFLFNWFSFWIFIAVVIVCSVIFDD